MQQHERLKSARIEAGYKSGTDAAKAMGVTVATYNSHENGHRGLTVKAAEQYADHFKVRLAWLLTGEEPRHYHSLEALRRDFDTPNPNEAPWGTYVLGKPYVGTPHGVFAEIDPISSEQQDNDSFDVVGEWGMPADFVREVLRAKPDDIFLLAVPDNLLAPTLKTGDRVIVTAVEGFRGDGLYVIQDDDHYTYIRRVAKTFGASDGQRMLIISTESPAYSDRVPEAAVKVIGKIIGSIAAL